MERWEPVGGKWVHSHFVLTEAGFLHWFDQPPAGSAVAAAAAAAGGGAAAAAAPPTGTAPSGAKPAAGAGTNPPGSAATSAAAGEGSRSGGGRSWGGPANQSVSDSMNLARCAFEQVGGGDAAACIRWKGSLLRKEACHNANLDFSKTASLAPDLGSPHFAAPANLQGPGHLPTHTTDPSPSHLPLPPPDPLPTRSTPQGEAPVFRLIESPPSTLTGSLFGGKGRARTFKAASVEDCMDWAIAIRDAISGR